MSVRPLQSIFTIWIFKRRSRLHGIRGNRNSHFKHTTTNHFFLPVFMIFSSSLPSLSERKREKSSLKLREFYIKTERINIYSLVLSLNFSLFSLSCFLLLLYAGEMTMIIWLYYASLIYDLFITERIYSHFMWRLN